MDNNKVIPKKFRKSPVILLVDDSLTIRRVIEMALNDTGWDLIEAKNGMEALKQTMMHDPDLIILDVMLPIYNGYQVCSLLKNNPKFKGIPVVMLTAKTGVIDKIRGRFAHADTYLSKPFSKEELVTACKKHLEEERNG
jgi:twitching motility two-component system response regulator PilG